MVYQQINEKECIQTWYYYVVLILHFLLTIFLYFGWLSNNKIVLQILFVLIIFCLIMYITLNGCVLTKLERNLSNSDFTVVDPLLKGLGIKIDKKSRYYITLVLYIITFFMTSYKLYFKKYNIKESLGTNRGDSFSVAARPSMSGTESHESQASLTRGDREESSLERDMKRNIVK